MNACTYHGYIKTEDGVSFEPIVITNETTSADLANTINLKGLDNKKLHCLKSFIDSERNVVLVGKATSSYNDYFGVYEIKKIASQIFIDIVRFYHPTGLRFPIKGTQCLVFTTPKTQPISDLDFMSRDLKVLNEKEFHLSTKIARNEQNRYDADVDVRFEALRQRLRGDSL